MNVNDLHSAQRPAMTSPSNLLIRGARVIDGSGVPWFHADVVVSGQRIAAILPPGRADNTESQRVVDADGMVLCPGFIDIQSHSIRSLFDDGRCISKISQGITTEIMGETWTPAPVGGLYKSPMRDGRGWPRFGQWLDAMVQHGVSPNVGSFLAGHTVRRYAMGMKLGTPDNEQLRIMQRVVAEAMNDGAFGLSYALIYPPDAYAGTDEIVALCRTAAQRGGMYITHMRSEADRLLEALDEAITIGCEANIPVEIYHLKACGRANWHKMSDAMARIDAARDADLNIAANMYPYTASATGLTAILPPWSAADGLLYDNLDDPAMRHRIRAAVINPGNDWEPQLQITGAAHVVPSGFERPDHQRYNGMPLDQIAADMQVEPVDAVIQLLRLERHDVFTAYHKMDEQNLAKQMRMPWVKFATDAPALNPEQTDGPVHPRSYGTMPRILGRYVREQNILTLEDAISRMTWQVARRLGLTDRGQLRVGAMADLVLLDPKRVADHATFEQPRRLATGILGVWVNGTEVWNRDGHTGATPGLAVRGPGALVKT